MEERHRRLYEQLGYTGPLGETDEAGADVIPSGAATGSAAADLVPDAPQAAGADVPQTDELPPLGPEGLDELERALDAYPEETLARARAALDEDISETELRANIARARAALESPDTAVAALEMQHAHMDAANPLPSDFAFEGMNLDEIDIRPGDTKFETVADAPRWVIFSAPSIITQVFKARFRRHTDFASGFAYDLDEPGAGGPLEVALFSDFGTGLYHSRYIAKQLRERKFPYAVHCGDVYYAGRRSEFEEFFAAPLDPLLADTQLFALNSNHEMMSGGRPYFEFMDRRRAEHPARQKQEGSYFSLASSRFQIVGIDTAYFDRGRHKEPGLLAWLAETLRAGRAAGRVNILLSGDHPYGYGHEKHSDLLVKDLAPLVKGEGLVDLWFWGNTHYCALFDGDAEHPFIGSCIGHGGYPYDKESPGRHSPAPLRFLETAARFPKRTGVRQDRGNNGYCVMSLRADGSVGLRYVDWMSRTRCEAELARTAAGRLRIDSVIASPEE